MNKQNVARIKVLAALLAVGLPFLSAAEPLHGIPFSEVTFSDTFWAPRIETNRVATIPHLLGELEKQGSLGGFRILTGDKSENYHGYMWGDSDVYKTLEGIAATLRLHADPGLARQMEQIFGSIAAAQAPDGYLFPHLQITEPGYRHFADETTRTCESYSIGHLIESALEHYRLTGGANDLAVACKAAELLRRTRAGGELLRVSGHPEIELALIELHQATGEPAWLELAASLIQDARRVTTLWSQGLPPLAGDEARGHAVAMLYLYSAATDLARLKGDAALAELMSRKWTNIVGRKLYVTGGLGHSGHSEGFAPDYDLPNDIAYCETCAAIANVFWQHRLFLAHGDAAYMDVLERSLYNNVLAGVALEGDRFFYVNPLATDGRRKFNQGLPGRFAWTGCPCCPVNLVRLIPRLGGFFYAAQGDDVFVNLFAAGRARIRLQGGELALRQATGYPWDGRVRIQIAAAPERPLTLRIRVPGWAKGHPLPTDLYRYAEVVAPPVTILLNGQLTPVIEEKGYAVLHRAWRPGDAVELNLPMPVRRVLARGDVKDNAGRVAVERGPLVYCVEGADNDGHALDLVLLDGADLRTVARSDLLGGITVIEAAGRPIASGSFRRLEPAGMRFIPYYAWNHRGAGPMAVWVPRGGQSSE
ncbi:MAG: glycoside hydrolase family 127 protein [Limisphaerales bacterium]